MSSNEFIHIVTLRHASRGSFKEIVNLRELNSSCLRNSQIPIVTELNPSQPDSD